MACDAKKLMGFRAVLVAMSVCLMCSANSPAFAGTDFTNRSSVVEGYDEGRELDPKDAIMIVRFNKRRVYFQTALKKVVDMVAGVKPDAVYNIQSVIPIDEDDVGVKYRRYNYNLRLVVGELNRMGVSIDRINIDIMKSNNVTHQELRIFIK
ncbi:MAG: hypothetical protein R3D71_08275 [Rickettsiales bacterium]